MKLVRKNADGTTAVSGNESLPQRPVPKEVTDRVREKIHADDAVIVEMARSRLVDSAALMSLPAGGEDAYMEAMRRPSR